MNMKSVEDVFIHLLSDTYSAEKQLTRALANSLAPPPARS